MRWKRSDAKGGLPTRSCNVAPKLRCAVFTFLDINSSAASPRGNVTQRCAQILALLLVGVVAGCASQQDVRTLRADMVAIERQRAGQGKAVEQQLITFGERLARLEQAQAESRRDLAQAVATLQELQVDQQRLHGAVQEAQHRLQRGSTPGARDAMATRLAELSTRLADLESRLSPTPLPSTPSASSQPPPATTRPPSTPAPRPPVSATPAFPSEGASPDMPPDGLYKRALQEYQQGNFEVAMVLFKQFLRQHPTASLAGNAQYWVGESLYAQKQFEAAIVAFDEVLRKYPKDTKVPAALLKQGYAFAELKDLRNARFFLEQVQKKFPDSPEAQQASEKLKQLQRHG